MRSKPQVSQKNPAVDTFLAEAERWGKELEALRSTVLASGLAEEIKWGQPCYTQGGHNVVILGELKDCCTLSFFKGALLKDPENILEKPGENTRAGRVIRFTAVAQIEKLKPVLAAYLEEAIAIEEAGEKVDFEQDREVPMPEELKHQFEASADFKKAWEALTPGRQRGYLLHFSGAKQPKTREARIEKYRKAIFAGKGMHDD